MKIISWQPVLTDHQSHTLQALALAGNCDLKTYVLKKVHAERQTQGWVNHHADGLSPEALPEKGTLRFAYRKIRENRDAIHLFGSPFERAKLIRVLLIAVALRRRVYLVSEPYAPIATGYQNDRRVVADRIKSMLRPWAYSFYGWLVASRIEGVFAISARAVRQYRAIGVPDEKLFPSGYFIPRLETLPAFPDRPAGTPGELRIVFVGNLIARKGLDVLIAAMGHLTARGLPISLDVFGPGDPASFSFGDKAIRYRGTVPFGQAQSVISGYDLLILPSRFDGWGVVVNEALLAGVPVVCSDMVGAGDLIGKWSCGTVFSSENDLELARKLEEALRSPTLLEHWRQGAGKVVEAILPEVAGRYMFNILGRQARPPKPECPWYEVR